MNAANISSLVVLTLLCWVRLWPQGGAGVVSPEVKDTTGADVSIQIPTPVLFQSKDFSNFTWTVNFMYVCEESCFDYFLQQKQAGVLFVFFFSS